MTDTMDKNEIEISTISTKCFVQSEIKSIIGELKFKPAEDRQYVPKISIVQRQRTPEEIEIEKIAEKYNL